MTLTQLFTAIANAIRAKTGSSDSIYAEDFPDEIADITTGKLTNEEYEEADDDLDDILENTVVPSGTLSIIANGVYDVTNYVGANVSVFNLISFGSYSKTKIGVDINYSANTITYDGETTSAGNITDGGWTGINVGTFKGSFKLKLKTEGTLPEVDKGGTVYIKSLYNEQTSTLYQYRPQDANGEVTLNFENETQLIIQHYGQSGIVFDNMKILFNLEEI